MTVSNFFDELDIIEVTKENIDEFKPSFHHISNAIISPCYYCFY